MNLTYLQEWRYTFDGFIEFSDETNNFDTNTGELIDGAPTFIDIKSQMRKAKTQDDLIVALDLSRSLGLSKDQVEQIENLYNERKQQME